MTNKSIHSALDDAERLASLLERLKKGRQSYARNELEIARQHAAKSAAILFLLAGGKSRVK